MERINKIKMKKISVIIKLGNMIKSKKDKNENLGYRT